MIGEGVQDPRTVREKRGAIKILVKKALGENSFTTLEDTEDDTSQENMKNIKEPGGIKLVTRGLTLSLLLSSCALSSFCSWSLFCLLYLSQNHSSC